MKESEGGAKINFSGSGEIFKTEEVFFRPRYFSAVFRYSKGESL